MIISLKTDELKSYVRRQCEAFFPDGYILSGKDVDIAFQEGLERLEFCFSRISFPAYCDQKGQTFFSHLHADQYAQFLYFFSNSLWKYSQNRPLCDKLLYLNRTLNSLFISYKAKMPKVFFLGHPVGTIIGNADYQEFLVVFQNVTINTAGTAEQYLPKIGKGCFFAVGATVIGNKPIGDRVSVGANAMVYDRCIPDDSVVLRNQQGQIEVRTRMHNRCMAQQYFNVII